MSICSCSVVLETAFTLNGQMLAGFCDIPGGEKPSHLEIGDWMSLHWACTNTGFQRPGFAWRQLQPQYLGVLYLRRRNLSPSHLGHTLCRRLTWVMAVIYLFLKSIDPIDHSFPSHTHCFVSLSLLNFFLNPFPIPVWPVLFLLLCSAITITQRPQELICFYYWDGGWVDLVGVFFVQHFSTHRLLKEMSEEHICSHLLTYSEMEQSK